LRSKAAIGGSEINDFASGGIVDASDSFLQSFEHDPADLLNRIIASARFAPFNCRAGIPSSPTIAYTVSDGASIPCTKFSMGFGSLTPQKVAALAVVSNEVLQADPRAADTLYRDLRGGVTLCTDAALIATLKAGLTPIPSNYAPAGDVHLLLDSVNLTGFGNLLLVCSPKLANAISCWPYDSDGGLTYPNMTPSGGTVCGVPVYVTAAMSDEEFLLVDINGLLAGPQEIDLQQANQTMINLDDAPGSSDDDETRVSMFQADCTAFRAVRHFGVKVVRASAVALVNGIVWEVAS
jgi:hypothetical protein